MKIVNRDLTKESIRLYVSNHQIYAEIWSKTSHKWEKDTYFKDYNFEVDSELIESTVNYIKRTWGLKAPRIIIE